MNVEDHKYILVILGIGKKLEKDNERPLAEKKKSPVITYNPQIKINILVTKFLALLLHFLSSS